MARMALTMRSIGQNDYSICDDGRRIGRIRYARERTPGVWLWHIQVHVSGGLPLGSASDLDKAKAEFKAAWATFKREHGAEKLAEAFGRMAIRDEP